MTKIEKRRIFSYNHINERNKKIDWTIRITFIVILFFGYLLDMRIPIKLKVL